MFEKRRLFPSGDENATRRKWQKNIAGRQPRWRGGHAAAAQVPVVWCVDFIWTPFNIHTQSNPCILNYDLRRAYRNVTCLSRGLYVFEHNGHHYRLTELDHDFEINTNLNLVEDEWQYKCFRTQLN